ncbi:uncharacterized protein LOC119186620 isoform X6 [Rhipicephalus microplus]|uniref:uncharacterized protein LOC119186620 isoform X6 n=1 Tax=Rhipicephalus microplus TaxID=6941 RepID=UPI003F6B2A04
MAYELRFHVIQVVLVWLPLVVHSGRPVDTPAKQLQFPEDCGFSTDPSACADTPELSRPFGTSSSSETLFLSSNKSGNSERQWFSGRGRSTTVAMAYELRFHVIQIVGRHKDGVGCHPDTSSDCRCLAGGKKRTNQGLVGKNVPPAGSFCIAGLRVSAFLRLKFW